MVKYSLLRAAQYSDHVDLSNICLVFQTQQSLTDKDYFARSHDPRDPRPAHVRYRVGQVMEHRIHGYRGVIIGWDPICKVMSTDRIIILLPKSSIIMENF